MFVAIRFLLLNRSDASQTLSVLLVRLVETAIALILVLLISHVFNLRHVQSTTIVLDVNVPLGTKEMDFHLVRRLEKENVSMM